MKRIYIIVLLALITYNLSKAQVKILYDATKAETAGSADWVIDADAHNLGYGSGPAVLGGGTESNAQQVPTPAQSGITSSTVETYWDGAISSWGIDMVKKGYYVETLPYNGSITYGSSSNAQDLSNYKVFIVDEPNIKFTTAEDTAIKQFVRNGGGLFMVSDHTGSDRNNDGYDSPKIWQMIMDTNGVHPFPFGISVDYVDISGTYPYVANLPGDPLLHGVMGNVTEVMWSDGTTFTLKPANNPTVKGVVYTTSSTTGNTGCLVAYSKYGAGRVVAMGDSSPTDDGTGDPGDNLYYGWTVDAGGNHERLIVNATIWLAGDSTLAIQEIDETSSVLVNQLTYPGFTKFVVSSSDNIANSEFCVYDMMGKLVMSFSNPVNSDIVIRNDKIGNGIYIYKLIVNGNAVKTGKFAIIK
ncbi:MAG: T9SS type A sorting domain-containing protein [Bacteroidales bacterium]